MDPYKAWLEGLGFLRSLFVVPIPQYPSFPASRQGVHRVGNPPGSSASTARIFPMAGYGMYEARGR